MRAQAKDTSALVFGSSDPETKRRPRKFWRGWPSLMISPLARLDQSRLSLESVCASVKLFSLLTPVSRTLDSDIRDARSLEARLTRIRRTSRRAIARHADSES
jgi:hypothetical protein